MREPFVVALAEPVVEVRLVAIKSRAEDDQVRIEPLQRTAMILRDTSPSKLAPASPQSFARGDAGKDCLARTSPGFGPTDARGSSLIVSEAWGPPPPG